MKDERFSVRDTGRAGAAVLKLLTHGHRRHVVCLPGSWRALCSTASLLFLLILSGKAQQPLPDSEPGSEKRAEGVTLTLEVPPVIQPGQPWSATVFVTNAADREASVELNYSLQRDSALYSKPLPDPVYGSNHAPGLKSWSVADGETIEEGSLTDGLPWTDAGTAYKSEHFTEAFQYVELKGTRRINRMSWLAGDANHTWFVDVAASPDGRHFSPVAGLQNVDQYKKWGWTDFPLSAPFEAKVIRFRYHTGDAGRKVPNLRFPCELALYDGVADETVALPRVGPVLAEGRVQAIIPARSSRVVDLPARATLEAGAGFVGMDASWAGGRALDYRHVFVAPPVDAPLVSTHSRFGLNAAHGPLASKLRDLGIGWVRFENMKWPFVSPAPHEYAFDGSVGPVARQQR